MTKRANRRKRRKPRRPTRRRPTDTSDATDTLLTVFVGPWVMAASLWMGAVMACTAPLGVAAMAVGEWRKLR